MLNFHVCCVIFYCVNDAYIEASYRDVFCILSKCMFKLV